MPGTRASEVMRVVSVRGISRTSAAIRGGETSTESFHLIVFVFTLTNKGPLTTDASADLTVTDVQGGSLVDVMCVLPNGFGINPDFPA